MVKINDRRHQAIGGQSNNRRESQITHIAWHYSGVARSLKRFITGHERHWRNTLGWRRGGYHYYIDADANVWQNYNLSTVSNGIGYNNQYTVHICLEANNANDYSQAQINARHDLTLMLMKRLNISAKRVMQHKEYPRANTACAGYSLSQMKAFRQKLASGQTSVNAGWKKNNTGWWWQNADGSYPHNRWQKISGTWYLFDNRGYMLTGWQKSKDTWYYMKSNGAMQTGWIKLNNHWYYLNASGAMQVGWFKVRDTWYYANGSGRMQTGWLKDKHGRWFYLYSNGAMATGLLKIGKQHYYLQRNGVLITDDVVEVEANRHGHLK